MSDLGSIITFMIVSFALAIVIILKKDSLPDQVKKPLAMITLVMVISSFVMMLVYFFSMG